jgi:hypothetical protein
MVSMGQAAPSTGPRHYSAVAGPYALMLSVLPRGRFTVGVTDRVMGMAVSGARITLRFSGMGAPRTAVVVPVLSGPHGRIAGRYATIVGLMPGAYTVRIESNGSAATVHIHLP